jgi:acetamidase/formamidase
LLGERPFPTSYHVRIAPNEGSKNGDPIMIRLFLLSLLTLTLNAQTRHVLKATPETVIVGYYDATSKPVLRIKPNDTVTIETLGIGAPEAWISGGVPADKIEAARIAIAKTTPIRGHILTGPIYIEGAEPGDTLELQILKVELAYPWAYNAMGRNGALADQFPEPKRRAIPLDLKRKVALFAPNVEIPLAPFFGSMGVAPPPAMGRVSSSPPGIYAGNLDNKELTAGTKLFIPIHVPGALFQTGDGHAGQGDGEVDQTGLETSLTGEFRFVLHKGKSITWPRAETPTHYIAMGLDPDLNVATKLAVQEAVDFLAAEKGLSRADAYMLASVAIDLHITQIVDGTKGVHAMIPKKLFLSPKK